MSMGATAKPNTYMKPVLVKLTYSNFSNKLYTTVPTWQGGYSFGMSVHVKIDLSLMNSVNKVMGNF